jgi:release factor family 3
MELLQHSQLRSLINPTEGPCISIFLPTHRGGVETKQGPIRLKNQIRKAEEQLTAQGMKAAHAKTLLEPVREICDNPGFWQCQSDGLAIFRSAKKFHYYRLPLHFEELLVITERFHVKPLLRLFTEDGRFYVLTLSKNEIRFFQCTRYGARQVELPDGTPKRLSYVLESAGVQKQQQVHSPGPSRIHGHGAREQDDNHEMKEFFRLVDRGVREIIGDDHAPLVLAGVDYLFPLYRRANGYPHLMEKGISGNPDGRRPEDLQSNAWAVVEPHFRGVREEAARRYDDSSGSNKTSNRVELVASAACQGRVEQLFVAVGKQIWGRWDETAQEAIVSEQQQPGDRDLLNLAAIQTLLQGGSVYAVPPDEVPGGGLLAGIFRY